ncbi:gliding motility-associated C-terminal domain-containing protein [Flavobacterium lacisediminis]|uniref:Gliding motility-associated C-terminal domain-containing protein n=1 Tax=Flavobacterium lacisediminis TaxID=2989705 RepID=A0ABT3EJ76_9FLAO|nr:gliding motility-associated C-terminal domain-containing protein [Flavobacterium lacisediminis]MCW1148623.1 gliding motility-associated C-terminal domain-containing protein [Flavobacterium lacisediminis]
MKKNKINQLLVLASLFAPLLGMSQTVNTGVFTIMPGTVAGSVGAIDNQTTGEIYNDGDFYVYSHYHNDGIVTFLGNTGLTRMRGLFGFQDLSGSIPMEWYNGEFNNTLVQPAFHLSNEVSIANEGDFQQGIVDDDNHGGLLVFEDDAYHINVDDVSHVDGFVRKNGDDAFKFPIGDGGYFRYSGISNPDFVTDAFSSKYFFENSDPLYPHSSKEDIIDLIDNAEYWKVEKTASATDVFLTLSWDEDTTPTEIYAAPYDEIHIVRWDQNEMKWIDEGGVADPNLKEVTTVIDPLTAYGDFTLARVRSVLPCSGRSINVYNAVSPNEDGLNDYFIIDGIRSCPKNKVEVYNRWGVKVYETTAYDTNGNVFKGISEGRATLNADSKLPVGTYFYILTFFDETGGTKVKKSGYLYLNYK